VILQRTLSPRPAQLGVRVGERKEPDDTVTTGPHNGKLPLERAAEDEEAQREYVEASLLAGKLSRTFDTAMLRFLQESHPELTPGPLAYYLEEFPGEVDEGRRRILEENLEDPLWVQEVLAEDDQWHQLALAYQ
jgi:hypothetical protein